MKQEQFIPMNQTVPVVNTQQNAEVITQTPERDAELKANVELGKAASDARFLSIVQKQVKWAQDKARTPAKITTAEEYGQASAVVKDMASALKSLEEVRLHYVAFPTRVVNMINGLFRATRQNIEENRTFLAKLIAKHDTEKEQERQRELAEKAKLNAPAEVERAPSGEVGRVVFDEVPLPPNSVSSAKPATTAASAEYDIVVEDVGEFMRALTSRAANMFWLTEHAGDLVTVNVEKVKEVLAANPSKRKIKGLRIVKK